MIARSGSKRWVSAPTLLRGRPASMSVCQQPRRRRCSEVLCWWMPIPWPTPLPSNALRFGRLDVKTKLTFKGDKACSTAKGEKPTCYTIHTDGNKFYEVRDDMKVHAISTVG